MWGLFLNPQSTNSPDPPVSSPLLNLFGGNSPMLGFDAPQLFSLPPGWAKAGAAALVALALRRSGIASRRAFIESKSTYVIAPSCTGKLDFLVCNRGGFHSFPPSRKRRVYGHEKDGFSVGSDRSSNSHGRVRCAERSTGQSTAGKRLPGAAGPS